MKSNEIPVGKATNLIGKKFNKLTVLYRVKAPNNQKGVFWQCQCDCGKLKIVSSGHLNSGHTKSCGCYSKEAIKKALFKDISGQRFGRLVALEPDNSKKGNITYWKCKCDCGKEITTRLSNLTGSKTQSCGCLNKEKTKQANTKDLTGQRFGKLIALEINQELTNSQFGVHWKCQCNCGNYVNVLSGNLVKRNTNSCGCLKTSLGEEYIQKILEQNNIDYIKEYKYSDLGQYRFDFYLPHYNRLIEFDGIQHYKENHYWEKLESYQQRDKIKNEYALSHNIPLVRIPYWQRDNITLDMIMGDKYLIKRGKGEKSNENNH